ncbi:2-keto-4-pentenoate hydratase [Cycloclasticus sp.]|jgi:2-keto-4-pentenoate hydratase|uniref:2-keto-4-pentenoate hydratase n=1 Tax=Cycloclasticus sp. TaxID=2024830 RepID=UPI000C0ECEC7|nr:2-keto-4-pentenoate hydratase [Cycloclasticus sp.]PHR50627.1 MAG: 2-keto-4-pentenoate hydratase [Cycloclasticus sp.]
MKFKFTFLIFAVAAVAIFFMRQENFVPRTALDIYQHFTDNTEADAIPGLTTETALEIQKHVVYALSENWGGIAGYKAAITNPDIQQKMGIEQPLLGIFLNKMLLESPAVININAATHPFAEADLLVRIKDSAINNAKTDQEILASIDQVIPFIEVPDRLFSTDKPLTADMLMAINTGARYGVMGEPIPMELIENLNLCQVGIVYEEDRSHLKTGACSSLMGNPVNVIRWLRDRLLALNYPLKPGAYLSLGSLTSPVPIKKGRLTAIYTGLGNQQHVSVSVLFK